MTLSLPKFMAHRGASAVAQENSLAALRKAAELGASWVEFDVMLTSDGVPVLHHDADLMRIAGTGRLMAQTSFAELRQINRKLEEPIPSLTEAIAELRRLGLMANVEIKPTPGEGRRTADHVVAWLAEQWREESPPLISSFDWEALEVVRALRPDWPIGVLIDFEETGDSASQAAGWRETAERVGAVSLHINKGSVTPEIVAEAKSIGLKVLAYTVNDPAAAQQLFALGVDSVFTDCVAEMTAIQ